MGCLVDRGPLIGAKARGEVNTRHDFGYGIRPSKQGKAWTISIKEFEVSATVIGSGLGCEIRGDGH